jgi:hypothetical protein
MTSKKSNIQEMKIKQRFINEVKEIIEQFQSESRVWLP